MDESSGWGEGQREGCRKREMLAGTKTPPTPSSRAPNNAGGRETESKRYVAHAFSTYSKEFSLLFRFERPQKKSMRGAVREKESIDTPTPIESRKQKKNI